MALLDKLLAIITENEIGGDLPLAYKFSDPDGLLSGKSGYSFGRVQFDIENNWGALHCLESCGFTPKEVSTLFKQNSDISKLDQKLWANRKVIDECDRIHIDRSIKWCSSLLKEVLILNEETFAHIVDYHNQFHFSKNGKLHTWLKEQGGTITPQMILYFKSTYTKWGRDRKDDVERRYFNIRKIYT